MDLDLLEKNKEPEGFAAVLYLLGIMNNNYHVCYDYIAQYMRSKYPKFFEGVYHLESYLEKITDRSEREFLEHVKNSYDAMSASSISNPVKMDLLKGDLKAFRKYQSFDRESRDSKASYDDLYNQDQRKKFEEKANQVQKDLQDMMMKIAEVTSVPVFDPNKVVTINPYTNAVTINPYTNAIDDIPQRLDEINSRANSYGYTRVASEPSYYITSSHNDGVIALANPMDMINDLKDEVDKNTWKTLAY